MGVTEEGRDSRRRQFAVEPDANDADGFLDGFNLNADSIGATFDGTTGYAVGYFADADCQLTALPVDTMDAAVVDIWAIVVNPTL